MKKVFALLGVLFLAVGAIAQTTTTTGTATDSDGTLWTNGTVAVQFVPNPSQPNVNLYNINGVPITTYCPLSQGPVSLGGTGAFSLSVCNNSLITPVGSQWQYTVCPNAQSKCGIFTTPVSGSSQNLTTLVDAAIPAPRFNALAGAYGYADVEAITTLPVGATYWNVTSLCATGGGQRYNNGSSWVCSGGSGGLPSGCSSTGTGNITCTGTITAATAVLSPNTPNSWLGSKTAGYAHGDGQEANDCTFIAFSATVACASAHFASTDVGKAIGLVHAGAAGSTNVGGTIDTTIATFVDAQHITVASAPQVSIQGPFTATCNIAEYIPQIYGCTGGTFNYGDIDKGPVVLPGVGLTGTHDSNQPVLIGQYISGSSMYVSRPSVQPGTLGVSSVTFTVPGATVIWGTDDTTAVQNTVSLGCATGSGVLLEPGTYLTTATINTCSGLYMMGTGTNLAILMPIGPAVSGLVYNSGASQFTDQHFDSFQIDMTGARNATYSANNGKALTAANGNRLWVHDMYIHGCEVTCLATDYTSYAHIYDNTLQYCGIGSSTLLTSGVVGGSCIGDGSSYVGQMLHLIENNTITDFASSGAFVEAQGAAYSTGAKIANNDVSWGINGPNQYNSSSAFGLGDQGMSGTLFSDNTVSWAPIGIKLSGADFKNAAYATNTQLSSNHISHTQVGILPLWANGSISLLGNVVRDSSPAACNIVSMARSGGTVTATTANFCGLGTADPFQIVNAADSSYDGYFEAASSSGTTITWLQSGSNSSTTGGELYPNSYGIQPLTAQTQFTIVSITRASNVVTIVTSPAALALNPTSTFNVVGVTDSTDFPNSVQTVATISGTTITANWTGSDASSSGGVVTNYIGYSLGTMNIAGGSIYGINGPAIMMNSGGSAALTYGAVTIGGGLSMYNDGGGEANSNAAVVFNGNAISSLSFCDVRSPASTNLSYGLIQRGGTISTLNFCGGDFINATSGAFLQAGGTVANPVSYGGATYYPVNLVPDSENVASTWTVQTPSSGTWAATPGAGIGGTNGFVYTGTGSSSGGHYYAYGSQILGLVPTDVYTLSANIDTTNTPGTTATLELAASAGGTIYCSVAAPARAPQAFGISTQCTIPGGVTTAYLVFDLNGIQVDSGKTLTFSAPMLTQGTYTGPYNPNYSGQGGAGTAWSGITAGSNSHTGPYSTAGGWTFSAAGAASTPGLTITGAPYTGGSATTNFPQLYVNSGTGPTSFSTAGTMIGANAPSGFSGNFLDFHLNGGSSLFNVTSTGAMTAAGAIASGGTVTAGASNTFTLLGRSRMLSPADGVMLFENNAQTSFTRMDFGGTTSSFAGLCFSGTTITVCGGDGSAVGTFVTPNFTVSGITGSTQCLHASSSGAVSGTGSDCGSSGGSGTVTSFSAGALSPLFTTSVATATTTPALSFSLSNASQNSVFAGPATGGSGAPSYQTAPTISAANMTSFPTFNQNTSGTAANLSGTPALPNGTSATTQTTGDNTTDLATDAFVNASITANAYTLPTATTSVLGGVKPDGTSITIASGVISASGGLSPATYYISPMSGTATTSFSGSINAVRAFGFVAPPGGVTFSTIDVIVKTLDATTSDYYSVSLLNSSGTIICHVTTGLNITTANVIMTNTCSEGSVTLTGGSVYIIATTGSASTGQLYGAAGYGFVYPYVGLTVSGLTSSSGVISGTGSITLAEGVTTVGPPNFTLH